MNEHTPKPDGHWYAFALSEIDAAVSSGRKRLTDFERQFLEGVPGDFTKPGIRNMILKGGLKLSPAREKVLRDIHQRMTEVSGTWRRGR